MEKEGVCDNRESHPIYFSPYYRDSLKLRCKKLKSLKTRVAGSTIPRCATPFREEHISVQENDRIIFLSE